MTWLVTVLLCSGVIRGCNEIRKLAHSPKATLTVTVRDPAGRLIDTGTVSVNGETFGSPGHSGTVPAGRVAVSHAGDGWHTDTKEIILAENAVQSVVLSSSPLPAQLFLTTTPPGADIQSQGRSLGRSPKDFTLVPGTYQLTASLDGYNRNTFSVTLGRGAVQRLNVTMVPAAVVPRVLPAPFERGVTVAATSLFNNPARDSDATIQLEVGTEVLVSGQVGGDEWLQVRGNGRAGYVPRSTVLDWDTWAKQNSVSGRVDSVQLHYRLVVNGRTLPLAGIQPPDPLRPAAAWQARERLISQNLRGVQVDCVPVTSKAYSCATTDPHNVAEMFLVNGAALTGPGATQNYLESQEHARGLKLGVWSDQ